MATEIKNKSEFVRGVLRDIGALTENPPEGWRAKVEEALKKQDLEMHQVMIYQIRRKAMEKAASEAAPAKKKPGRKPGQKTATKVAAPKATVAAAANGLSLDDILNARKVADDFGGVGKLSAALTALNTINTTLLGVK